MAKNKQKTERFILLHLIIRTPPSLFLFYFMKHGFKAKHFTDFVDVKEKKYRLHAKPFAEFYDVNLKKKYRLKARLLAAFNDVKKSIESDTCC